MDLETYRRRRLQLAQEEPKRRQICLACFQPEFGCYCSLIRRFDPGMQFVILIHPIEVKRRIATGRMSHLSLEGSKLIRGEDYTQSAEVNAILNDPKLHPMILYPGRAAINISPLSPEAREDIFPQNKKLAIFVIDGTWTTARKMLHRSQNLKTLPQFCFTPSKPSRFRVRKQPAAGCYSTIEAIHETIELLGPARGFDTATREHDGLLHVFDEFVERQLKCIATFRNPRQGLSYRRERKRSS